MHAEPPTLGVPMMVMIREMKREVSVPLDSGDGNRGHGVGDDMFARSMCAISGETQSGEHDARSPWRRYQ